MGGFVQGLGQGMQNVQSMQADIENRRQQAELFKLKSKQLKLETDMTEKQLKAQADLPNMLFGAPQQRQVTAQGPGAPQPIADPGLMGSFSPGELAQGQGREEGPQPTGMADVPGTGGPWANMSPEFQNIARSILTSTGGDMPKTIQTLELLAPGVFPKQPMIQKLGEGETLQQIDPRSGQSRVLAQGQPKYHAPISVGPDHTVLDPQTRQPIFSTPSKPGKPGDGIKVVDGKAYRVVMEGGEEVLRPMKGQEAKPEDSPKNPVDQYIFANSQYKNMAEAKAAGQDELVRKAEEVVREQRPLQFAEAKARIVTADIAERERQSQEIKLEAPLEQEKRANLFDRKAFLEGKNVRLPPGTSKGAAARADVIEITDKQMADVQTLDNAMSDMDTLFSMANRLITAKDWKEANFKQFPALKGGSFTGMNADAATYEKDVQAFSTNLARAFGHEKGVMTDQDIARWTSTIPTFRDTAKTRDAKRAMFNEIRDNAIRAQRRAIAGDDLGAVRSELQQKIQPILKRADAMSGKNDMPPVPDHLKHLPKDLQDSWQQTYMEQTEGLGQQ